MLTAQCPACGNMHTATCQSGSVQCPTCGAVFALPAPTEILRFSCPTCAFVMKCPRLSAGQKVACINCGQRVLIPAPKPKPVNKTTLGKLEGSESAATAPPEAPEAPIPIWPEEPSRDEPGQSEDDPDEESQQTHSGLGIASFLIAVLVGGMEIILIFIIAIGMASVPRGDGHEIRDDIALRAVGGGVSLVCLNCASVPFALVGLGLGVVALIAHRGRNRRNHLFTWVGTIANGVVILAVVGFYLLVSLLSAAGQRHQVPRRF